MPPSRIWLLVIPGSVLVGLLLACCEPQASNAIDPAASSAATRRVPIITLLRSEAWARARIGGKQGFNNLGGGSSGDLVCFGGRGLQRAGHGGRFLAPPPQREQAA